MENVTRETLPSQLNREQQRQEKLDRLAQDIIAVEASKLIEEAYKTVFEGKVTEKGHTDSNKGDNEQISWEETIVEGNVQDIGDHHRTVADGLSAPDVREEIQQHQVRKKKTQVGK